MGSFAQDTQWLDATAQAELVANGEASAVELVDAAVERIESHDETLNSVVMRWFDHGRETASAGPPRVGLPGFRSYSRICGPITRARLCPTEMPP